MILPLLLLLTPARAARAEPPSGVAASTSTAGSVVRSKEWIVRRGKSREEEFIGDVRYDSAGTKLSSDWALYRQGPNDWKARGHIAVRRELSGGDVVETVGETAWYDENTLKGRLEPAPGARIPILHTPPEGGPDHAEGDHLTWIGETVGILSGRSRGWGPRGEFWADTARYDRELSTRSLTLSGNRPVIHNFQGGDDAGLKADRIVVFDPPRRAVASGRVLGWVISLSTSMPKAGPEAIRCGQGDRSEGPGPDPRVSALLTPLIFGPSADDERRRWEAQDAALAGLNERVFALLAPLEAGRAGREEIRFWQAEEAAFASRACPWGARYEFWSDNADYAESPDRLVFLNGGRPVLHKIDDDQSTAVKADTITAYGNARRVVAVGKVRGWMVFKEEKKRSDKKEKKKTPEKTK
ncbi:MAG: hypothetical protein ACHQ2Z_10990 [Elusimicrobiota bacterium]